MRKQFFILGILVTLLQFKTQASALSSRGFIANKCYGHVGKFIRENKNCYLEVFSENKTHLSFQLDQCPNKPTYKTAIYARFKILNTDNKIIVHLIGWTPVDPKINMALGNISNGFAQFASCN